MAKVSNQDYSVRRGKLNKKDPVIYRNSYGKQQIYTASAPSVPPSEAQKANRSNFGKTTAIVNAIVTDPNQAAEWEQKRIDYNRSVAQNMYAPRYRSLRKFVHAVISEQIAQNEASKSRRKPIQKALPKGIRLHVKPFAELSTTELYELIKARFNVFYLEQHIQYPDLDDIDYLAIHLALHRKGRVIAYARMFPANEPGIWHVGRLLTTERGQGFGKYIMSQVEQEALNQGAVALMLNAQTQVVPFYESLGFTAFGEPFIEAGISHIAMRKTL